jgi:hypothetical protein
MAGKPVEVFFARQSRPEEYREQGDERLINAYAETMGEGRNAKMRVRMSPGLTAFASDANDIACRGAILSGDYVYAVFETGVYKIDSTGARTSIGAISGTGPVYMALNANAQIGVVTRLGRYYVIEDDEIQPQSTADIGLFNSICWVSGCFVLTLANGTFYTTGLNDAKSITGTDTATAEGSPDGLVGGFAHGSELWLFGTETTEVWAFNGAPPPGAPFARQGGSWINKGCLSFASVVQADNTVFWVGNDRLVYRNANYTPQRISHEGVERDIARVSDPSTIRGGTYTIDGHAFYVLSCSLWTWVYDIKERRWHERRSRNLNRWKAEVFINAFGMWLVGTVDDGTLYEIDMSTTLEGSDLMVTTARSLPMGDEPDRAVIFEATLDFVTGRAAITGTAPQTDPYVELRYSDDGGATWSMPRQLPLGTQGQYRARCVARRLGRTGRKWGRIWEWTCSDPHVRSMERMLLQIEALA